jgi:hypothetical protein
VGKSIKINGITILRKIQERLVRIIGFIELKKIHETVCPNVWYLITEDTHVKLIRITGLLVKKSKVVPLHAMEAHGGRGGIAPTHT